MLVVSRSWYSLQMAINAGGMGVWGDRSGKVLIKTPTIETAKAMGGNLG